MWRQSKGCIYRRHNISLIQTFIGCDVAHKTYIRNPPLSSPKIILFNQQASKKATSLIQECLTEPPPKKSTDINFSIASSLHFTRGAIMPQGKLFHAIKRVIRQASRSAAPLSTLQTRGARSPSTGQDRQQSSWGIPAS